MGRVKIVFPRRKRGRPRADDELRYRGDRAAFCEAILEINSTLDFRVSSRGWCYILEEHGLTKGDFDVAQTLINECRKEGSLPLDICAVDDGRSASGLEKIDDNDPEEEAEWWIGYVRDRVHTRYSPISFWEELDVYVEMAVEKVDLVGLFTPECQEFRISITNIRGWNDINSRAAMMLRFKHWEAKGKRCILLYCGDHDPGGLHISSFLKSNMADVAEAVGWWPNNLVIDRFGLNKDFIDRHGLTWIDNLETSSGDRLDDPKHKDHYKPYVQDYLREFGARKVEANALVVRPEAGRALCRQAILRHVPEDAPERYEAALQLVRAEMHEHVLRLLDAAE